MPLDISKSANFCFILVPGNPPADAVGCVVLGESGYNATTYTHCATIDEADELVRYVNDSLRVPPEVASAMLTGSMFGWDVPGARAAHEHFAS